MYMVEGLTIASARSRIDVLRVFFPNVCKAFSVMSVKIMDVFAFVSCPTFLESSLVSIKEQKSKLYA